MFHVGSSVYVARSFSVVSVTFLGSCVSNTSLLQSNTVSNVPLEPKGFTVESVFGGVTFNNCVFNLVPCHHGEKPSENN